ncbi:hypothetical protein [Bartonella sp. SD1336NMGDW]|uniref:hypothetical protein n=1 Tax=Bartonella sp. SD1336NMGDW TaxID=3243575 RepID=UPI0035D12E4B
MGQQTIACWCFVAGRLLMSLGCEGRIDHLISIAEVWLRKKKGACFGANRWGSKQSFAGALLRESC